MADDADDRLVLCDTRRLGDGFGKRRGLVLKTFRRGTTGARVARLYADRDVAKPVCAHAPVPEQELVGWLEEESKAGATKCCPRCEGVFAGADDDEPPRMRYTPSDDLFRAFNLAPDKFAAHAPIAEIDGPPPTFEDGEMMWRHFDGRTGRVPMRNGRRLRHREYDGIPPSEVDNETVDEFRIAYTVAYPATRSVGDLDDLPLIGMLHGVPGNRRWKYGVMRELAKFAVVVCWDMLGMGESDQVLDYKLRAPIIRKAEPNEAWDWKHDVPYVHQLMTQHIPDVLRMQPKPWVSASDDWGCGDQLHYAAAHDEWLLHSMFVNPIWLDGYPVVEIATIGKMAVVRRTPALGGEAAFVQGAFGLPQAIVGIEKYMVEERWKMNRYTETDYLYPYQDVDYQAGRNAGEMRQNFWNLAVLADRAERLAPRQLQPWHRTENPRGVQVERITKPVDLVWGKKGSHRAPVA
jgi:hypothetical protein